MGGDHDDGEHLLLGIVIGKIVSVKNAFNSTVNHSNWLIMYVFFINNKIGSMNQHYM